MGVEVLAAGPGRRLPLGVAGEVVEVEVLVRHAQVVERVDLGRPSDDAAVGPHHDVLDLALVPVQVLLLIVELVGLFDAQVQRRLLVVMVGFDRLGQEGIGESREVGLLLDCGGGAGRGPE